MSISISMHHYLSLGHLSVAAMFASQWKKLESTAQSTPIDSPQRRQHNAYAISSVIVSGAFLEATINELFSDCSAAHSTEPIASLPAKYLMGNLWRKGIRRTTSPPIFEKYKIALKLNRKPTFKNGNNPYQDAKLLSELRNATIHCKPETIVEYSGHETPRPQNLKSAFL